MIKIDNLREEGALTCQIAVVAAAAAVADDFEDPVEQRDQ